MSKVSARIHRLGIWSMKSGRTFPEKSFGIQKVLDFMFPVEAKVVCLE